MTTTLQEPEESQGKSLVGEHLGEWLLTRVLGDGGMSVVYAGRHLFQEDEVAIKLLHPDLYDSQESLVRFHREIQVLQSLNHPGVVQILESGDSEDHGPFIILEMLQGEDLGQKILRDAPLPLSWLLSITEHLCEALQVVHDNGVIHRDLKPSNVFLVPNQPTPTPKMIDFGVAHMRINSTSRLTQTGMVIGSPAYLAPEQLLSGKSITASVDIYSLGVLWFEALTGKLPMQGGKRIEELLANMKEDPLPLGVYRPEFADSSLKELLQRCLAKKPENRPSSASLLWEELEIACQFLEDPLDEIERPSP